MRAVQERPQALKDHIDSKEPGIRMAPVFDSDRAARALSDFLEDAREILDRIQESYREGEEARPYELAGRDILRHLSGAKDEVEFHDLPSVSGLGIARGRALVRAMAERGHLKLERDQTYPNMMYLWITDEGREELRRIGVKEAMAWMHGAKSGVAEAVGNAREALARLVEVIAA